jgi:hypothetical protein
MSSTSDRATAPGARPPIKGVAVDLNDDGIKDYPW